MVVSSLLLFHVVFGEPVANFLPFQEIYESSQSRVKRAGIMRSVRTMILPSQLCSSFA